MSMSALVQVGYVNSLEWNDGLERWSGVLDWSTGVPHPQIGDLIDA